MSTPIAERSGATLGRNLVVCCDGTNNTLTGGVEDTNVLLLYSYLLKHADRATTVCFYDPGVGTPDAAPPTDLTDLVKRKASRIAGLASGRGVYENIAEAYRFLMNHWRGTEDRIFCFGFSRGAFTARCVVGMVNMFGVIRPEHDALLPTLIRIYFSQPPESEQVYGKGPLDRRMARALHRILARPDKAGSETAQGSEEAAVGATRPLLAEQVRRSFGTNDPKRRARIHWVGVWDTVESVGFPVLFSRDNPATASFRDKPGILNVRHALALDEHRLAFRPRLYDEPGEVRLVEGDVTRTLKQLWFPGVHCDVGGSYTIATAGLADQAWLWMFNEVAAEFGLDPLERLPVEGPLPFDDLGMPRDAVFPSPLRLRHDALWDTPLWALAGMTTRHLEPRHSATLREVRAAPGQDPSLVGVTIDARPAPVAPAETAPSVWDRRRKTWPLLVALALMAAGLWLTGWNLSDADAPGDWPAMHREACRFAMQQLASSGLPAVLPDRWVEAINRCGPVAPTGLRDAAVWQEVLGRSPIWAMVGDLLVIAGFGYLLARIASRAFTFLAGVARPGEKHRAWLGVVGLLPVATVLADVAEDLLTVLAVALQRSGTPAPVALVLWGVGLCSIAKIVLVVASFGFFGGIRAWLVVGSGASIGKVGRK